MSNHIKYVSSYCFLSLIFSTLITRITTTCIKAKATMVAIFPMNIVKFDGSRNFELWQRRVRDELVWQGMVNLLSRKQPK